MIRMLLATLLLACAASATWAQAKPQPGDELRYDGKPFAYWDTLLRTELKPEKRIEAVRALRAFGARGYAREASVAIVELLKEFDYDEETLELGETESAADTAEQRLLRGAVRALVKIGPEASNAMAPHLDHLTVRVTADALFGPGGKHGRPISESSVPALVQWIASKNADARDAAIGMLAYAIGYAAHEKCNDYRTAFLDSMPKHQTEKAIVGSLVEALDGPREEHAAALLGILGARARSAVPALAKMLENSRNPGRSLITAYVKLEPDSSRAVRVLRTALERNVPDPNAGKLAILTYTAVRGNVAFTTTPAYGLIVALGDHGAKAASAVPLLLKVFDQADDHTKLAIVETLGKIGPAAKAALPLLTRLSDSAKAGPRVVQAGGQDAGTTQPQAASAELGHAADAAITAIRAKQ